MKFGTMIRRGTLLALVLAAPMALGACDDEETAAGDGDTTGATSGSDTTGGTVEPTPVP